MKIHILSGLIIKYLSKKFNTKEVVKLIHSQQTVETYIQEIEDSIRRYNNIETQSLKPLALKYYINTIHTKKSFQKLPTYNEIIEELIINKQLQIDVFTELSESTYFHEVYQIPDNSQLMINLLILFYRTSLLILHPELRDAKVQISSTLEEMSALMYLEGRNSEIFKATKHWIKNWKKEYFSKELANLIPKD